MRTELDKGSEELVIFAKFIREAGIELVPDSIQKRLPPEPDIYCELRPNLPIAFELAEACAPEFAVAEKRAIRDGVAVTWGADVSEDTIRKKLKKSYSVSWPVELLLYTNGRTALSDDQLCLRVKQILDTGLGPFRRVWLMGGKVSELAHVEDHHLAKPLEDFERRSIGLVAKA